MADLSALITDPSTGPTYNYAEQLLPPSAIGVRVGDTFGQVYDNIKGVNYYVDAIGFGQGTFLNDKPMQPLGIRYFLNTGFTCSNGASRYQYVDTTPQGDSVGQLVKTELAKQGLPALRGLAPGMLEDAEIALNPIPLFRAAVGDTGYSQCELVEKPVGDLAGATVSRGGTRWLTPDYTRDGRPYQKRWIETRPISKAEYDATPKIYNPNGTLRPAGDVRVEAVRVAGGLEPFAGPCIKDAGPCIKDAGTHNSTSEEFAGQTAAGAVVFITAALAMFFMK